MIYPALPPGTLPKEIADVTNLQQFKASCCQLCRPLNLHWPCAAVKLTGYPFALPPSMASLASSAGGEQPAAGHDPR